MLESGTDRQTAVGDAATGDRPTPAALAVRVAAFRGNGQAVDAGSLPAWDRAAEPRRRTWLSRLMHVAAWCVTLGLLVVAALRISYHDAAVPLIWLNAFTLYVYLPAYVVLAVAVRRHHWLLAAASAAVVVCHVAWIAPDFQPATQYPRATSTTAAASPPVRIFFANVRATNENYNGILSEIANADPDIVVLVEFHRWAVRMRSLQWDSVMKPFVYGTPLANPHPGEVVVFSKLPVERQKKVWAAGRVCQEVDIPLAGTSLRLFCLHSPRPYMSLPQGYKAYWEKVTRLISEQPTPLAVIGDFNGTQHSSVYQRLTSTGLRSAHVDRGRGYATTWPNGQQFVPPIRIDHALISPDVECLDIAEGVGSGSDHRPLIVEIRVHATEGRASEAAAGG